MNSAVTSSDQQPIFHLGGFNFLETQIKLQRTIRLYSSPLKTGLELFLENRGRQRLSGDRAVPVMSGCCHGWSNRRER